MADVQLWCSICGASGQRTAELLAEQAAAARLWSAYRDLGRHGLNATQKLLVGDMFERVRLTAPTRPRSSPDCCRHTPT